MEESINHCERGLAAMKSGDLSTAVAEFEAATQVSQGDYKVFNYLGAAYAAKGLYEKAIGAFKLAEQIAPNIARVHYNIAQAYEAVGIIEEAQYEYGKALELDPGYEKASIALTSLQSRAHQVREETE